jgi:CrcB protein
MMSYLMVAVGGAVGACGRYAVYNLAVITGFTSQLATFVVNVLGALAIGVLYVVITERSGLQPYGQQLLSVGFLGAFTTYSTYSLDALRMLERGEAGMALLYLVGTMLVCLVATWLGLSLARYLF